MKIRITGTVTECERFIADMIKKGWKIRNCSEWYENNRKGLSIEGRVYLEVF